MSIKPVDMQILLPRSQEIQRGETIKDSKSNSNNQFVLIENEKETVKKTKQINETNKSEEVKISEEGKKSRDQNPSGFASSKKKQEEDCDFTPSTLGKNIDIKI